ncbi:hypothetical protein RCO28_18760 [Streptomyces sp. LHD-70]|uniref:hypothetical protein n=1 Tax=Streptomyces sp. LHD-70 TaxID=3072140 RepID=UPI00280E27B4|nr:hypothetical protein [Streptomyces sp. LHD-70]MDQ8704514.1 hypothetical protein [Streptomyces sp. LHD-70]
MNNPNNTHDDMNEPARDNEDPLAQLSLAYVRAGRALHLAFLDDIATRIRSACHQDARYLEVTIDPETDDVTLHSIWSEQTDGLANYRQLCDLDADSEDWTDDPLALHQLVHDLENSLATGYLQTWGLVRPHPNYAYPHRRWIVLPPADRIDAIAELVRAYVPNAEGLVCSFRWAGHAIGVCLIAVIDTDGQTTGIPCGKCTRDAEDPWPLRTSHTLAHLLAQVHALPHLSDGNLLPFGGPTCDDEVAPRLLPLPSANPTSAP